MTAAAAPVPAVCPTVCAFLRSRLAPCFASTEPNAARGFLFTASDTSGVLVGDFTAHWFGDDAVQFVKDHGEELRPGRTLELEVYGIRLGRDVHRLHVKACRLGPLPPSWQKHLEKQTAPTTESNA